MKKIIPSVVPIVPILTLAFFGVSLSAVRAPAQAPDAPPPAFATITFANGSSITVRGREYLRRVGLLPREAVSIRLQLPPQLANTVVAAQAMDGGTVSGDITIAADGTGALGFRAGDQPGLYRVLLSAFGRSATLQFWVSNQQ